MHKMLFHIALQKVQACPGRHVEHFCNVRWDKSLRREPRFYCGSQDNNWVPFSLNTDEPLTVEKTFTMTETTEAGVEIAFHLGNGVAGEVPFDVIFDDVYNVMILFLPCVLLMSRYHF